MIALRDTFETVGSGWLVRRGNDGTRHAKVEQINARLEPHIDAPKVEHQELPRRGRR